MNNGKRQKSPDRFFKLSNEDIKIKKENSLDLFYYGIKSALYKESLDRSLRKFLLEVCADLLKGDYKQRAQEFVDLVRENQEKATSIVLAYVRLLRKRTTLAKSDPNYLNPSSIPNRIKPIKKLLEVNGLGLPWKRIQNTYPELDNINKGRGYTREEIKKLLEYSEDLSTDFVILASSSGGFRLGGWRNLVWGDVFPVYKKDGSYLIEIDNEHKKDATVVCAAMVIYKSSPEEYYALISIEAWEKLQEYKKMWKKKMNRNPEEKDPLILERFKISRPLTDSAIKSRIEKLLINSGIRSPLVEGKRRHDVPLTNGFRRYWDKVMMKTSRKKNLLSSLVIKERLMGHEGLVKTDKNYFWTDLLELVPEYLEAMPELMISEEYRSIQTLKEKDKEIQTLRNLVKQKDQAVWRLVELEAKFERFQRYSGYR